MNYVHVYFKHYSRTHFKLYGASIVRVLEHMCLSVTRWQGSSNRNFCWNLKNFFLKNKLKYMT